MSTISETFLCAVLAAFCAAVIGTYNSTFYATEHEPTCAAVPAAQHATVISSLLSASNATDQATVYAADLSAISEAFLATILAAFRSAV